MKELKVKLGIEEQDPENVSDEIDQKQLIDSDKPLQADKKQKNQGVPVQIWREAWICREV